MAKELCKMKKLCGKDFGCYAQMVNRPRVICTKCGRAANSKKSVCSPRKIGKVI
ncbi:MAG: hypothetical protein HF973_06190 [Chloroflexi bacterium]|nr:hypothetical protein [Chloroflexota bacterium]